LCNKFRSPQKKESDMMKATKFAVVLMAAGLTVGCASKSDITNLQTQIDGLKAEQASIKSTADEALSAAQAAESKAGAAEAAARRAAAAAEETNSKLDRMFKKSMMK
jgi:outer membrane murein-binding lipoprotein Lpp